MVLHHVIIVFVQVWNIRSPGLVFLICLIFKLGGWFLWGSSIDVMLWVMISHNIVSFVVFWHKRSMLWVMIGYILWLQILQCAVVYITGSFILITTSMRLGVGKYLLVFTGVMFVLHKCAKCPNWLQQQQMIWTSIVRKLLIVSGALGQLLGHLVCCSCLISALILDKSCWRAAGLVSRRAAYWFCVAVIDFF